MATQPWPLAYCRPATVRRHIAPRTTAGTVSASGFTQRNSVPAHAWVIEFDGIVLKDANDRYYWDQFEAYLDGGAVPVLVPLVSDYRPSLLDGQVSEGASAGETVITINSFFAIPVGQHFSIGERLYRVSSVGSPAGDDYPVTIRPPLREDILLGDPVVFSLPVCRCRLASDDEMALEIDVIGIGRGKVKFVEDPNTD